MLQIESTYWTSAAWGLALVAVALSYWWEARARCGGPVLSNLASHPILLVRPAWAALTRQRGVFGLLLALWTMSALEDWGRAFWLNRSAFGLRDVWAGLDLASLAPALRGTSLVFASTLRAVPPDHSTLAGGSASVLLIAGLSAWALLARDTTVAARIKGPLWWMLAVACVCLGLSVLANVAALSPELTHGVLDWLWVPSWLTSISVTDALLQCYGVALIWGLLTDGAVSARDVVSKAAACFGPLLGLQLVLCPRNTFA